jgi:hypothetical protein
MNKNIALAIACLLLSSHVMAGGWGQLSGKNAQGQLVTITDETRSGKHAILVSDMDGEVEYPFQGACSFDLDESAFQPPVKFSCNSQGQSPLAGTAYEQTGKTEKCRVMRFKCVAGCNSKRVPALLKYHPWEC